MDLNRELGVALLRAVKQFITFCRQATRIQGEDANLRIKLGEQMGEYLIFRAQTGGKSHRQLWGVDYGFKTLLNTVKVEQLLLIAIK
jgi:hypothetical protein